MLIIIEISVKREWAVQGGREMNIFYGIVLIAAVLWGTTGTAQMFLQGEISAVSVAMIRSGIGGGILLLAVILLRKIQFKQWSWKWTFLAALAIGLFQVLFFSSIRYTGVAVGTVVTIGSSPVFAGVIEWVLWRVKPTKVWAIATCSAIVGCALLFLVGGETVVDPFGVMLALMAGFMFALYTNVSKRLMEQEEPLPAVAMTFSICALLLLPFAWSDGFQWVIAGMNGLTMLYLGIFSTSIAYILFLSGLQKISSSSAVTLSLAEPLTAALLGVFFLDEQLSPVSWIGVAFILMGIIVLTFGARKDLTA